MVSYAQNFEDVMLWRALKNIENGFYVDVGANDPIVDSVTKYFYDSGWHGINIEPVKRHWEALKQDRPQDINLAIAAGEKRGQAVIFEPAIRGWATLDPAISKKIESEGISGTTYQVEVKPLHEILAEHEVKDIHFLKIDVEGFEKEVLAGADFSKFRPWILVIEATRPSSQEISYSDWEYILINANYQFVYFDGLNRFYLATEHKDLAKYFEYPPCVFDGFTLRSQAMAEARAQEAEAKAAQAEAKAAQAETKAAQAETKAAQAEGVAQHAEAKAAQAEGLARSIMESRSWKITAPLRALGRWARRLKRAVKILLTDPRLFTKKVLVKLLRRVGKNKIIKKALLLLVRPFPQFKARLKTMVNGRSGGDAGQNNGFGSYSYRDLSPQTRQIYKDLKTAIKQKQKQGK